MIWKLILFSIIALIILAIAAETWLKRKQKRPLSRHSANKRRWDDPNRAPEEDHVMHTSMQHRQLGHGMQTSATWSISRNPHEQAKALMPDDPTQTKDPK